MAPESRLPTFARLSLDPPFKTNLPAHRAGNRVVLDDPMDDSALGSPMIARSGAVAMLQDERSGLLLSEVRGKRF